MRKRSESFYANSLEEFTSLTESASKVKSERKASKLSQKLHNLKLFSEENKLKLDAENESEEDNLSFYLDKSSCSADEEQSQLAASGAFKMTVYEKYAIEQDEDVLIGSLANINESIRSKDKSLFLENISNFLHKNIRDYNDKSLRTIAEIKSRQTNLKASSTNKNDQNTEEKPASNEDSFKFTRSFSFHSIQDIDVNFNDLGKKNDILSFNSKCSTVSSNFLPRSPAKLFINDPILAQNILKAQAALKILVIGDEKVGKSFFVNRFQNKKNFNNHNDYVHTESLEISKNLIYLVNKTIKLEIYDTNRVILESQLFKTYINICDCFILIFDPTVRDSISFIEEKLREINKSHLNPDILLIGNIRFIDCNDDKLMLEKSKKFKENDIFVKRLIANYTERLHYIDLKNLDNFKKIIKKFLVTTFLKKRNSVHLSHKNKFNYRSVSSSRSITNKIVCRSENKSELNNSDKSARKTFKSLSFNLSESDNNIYE